MKLSMTIRTLHKSDGIALIIVMCAIVVLSILAAAFAYSMKVETRLAQNSDSEQQLLWLGRSGVELACYVLSQQMTIPGEPYDSLNQIWAGGPGGPGETNSALSGLSLNNYPVGDGTVSVKIVDLERKVNINTAIYPANNQVIIQALTLMGVDANNMSVVSDSVLDWIGPPGPARVAGAEDEYYQALAVPYHVKNAPVDNLSELMLVRGVTPELYWGSNSTNHIPSVFQHKLGLGTAPGEEPDYPFGLAEIFTPISSGKININTADINVLQMIPGVDAATAATLIQHRAGPDGVDGTEDDLPFRDASSALQNAGVNPPQNAQQLYTTRSLTFEVHVNAQIGDYRREYIAILFRSSARSIQVVSFYWK